MKKMSCTKMCCCCPKLRTAHRMRQNVRHHRIITEVNIRHHQMRQDVHRSARHRLPPTDYRNPNHLEILEYFRLQDSNHFFRFRPNLDDEEKTMYAPVTNWMHMLC